MRLYSIFVIIAVAGLLALILLAEANRYVNSPVKSPGREVQVHIPAGWDLKRISHRLVNKEVLDSAWRFRLLARLEQDAAAIQAGEFKLHSGWTPKQILKTLVSGQEVLYRLSIPEGLTWWEVAERVGASELTTSQRFKAALEDEQFLSSWDIPSKHAEGFLFPETYFLPRSQDQDPYPILRAMFGQFWDAAQAKLWPEGRPPRDELLRVVTLASLVEKETALDRERARVAGVFANRLQRGMRLQCDPTVIYGIGPGFDGNLKHQDLQDAGNPYNTYRHPGLPPGPICSPGIKALEAALDPEDHDYLYFVAKGQGGHHFSSSLNEHNRAVRRYQLTP